MVVHGIDARGWDRFLQGYQRAAVGSKARLTWNCWARQTGKSFTFSLRRMVRGIGRRRDQIILSAGGRQSREVMEKVRGHCDTMNDLLEPGGYFLVQERCLRALAARLPRGMRIL